MSAKRLAGGAILVLIAIAFVAGYWPEHQRRIVAEAESASAAARLAALDDRDHLAAILGELLNLTDAVAAMNYGQAQSLSSIFFDAVAAEAARTHNAGFKTALEAILQRRDAVTGLVVKGDAAAMEPLREAQHQLRQVLGYL